MDKLVKAAESNEEIKQRVETLFEKAVSKNMFYQDNEIKAYLLRLIDNKKKVASGSNQPQPAKMLKQDQNQTQNNRYQNNRNQYQNNRFQNNRNQNQQQFEPRQSFNQRSSYTNSKNNSYSLEEFRRKYIQEEGR